VNGYKYKRGIIKNVRKPLILLFLVSLLNTCIDQFDPDLKGIEALLVVDASVTNENRSYVVELSRTRPKQNSEPIMVPGAVVIIKDQNGNESKLQETATGIYKTDSLLFRGETGNAYTLDIKTPEGTEYESDPCIMYPVQQIDSIYYDKDQEFQNNGSEIQDGIRIFIDSENTGDGKYLRWIYNEWWKFSVPTPKLYDYIDEFNIPEVDVVKQVCYGYNKSNEIIIHSTESAQSNRIEKEPILFVASDKSDRLSIQYCIEIRQLSLSQTEFEFWNQMKQINESGKDIFEKQPFSIVSNIHNISNPGETVLGYFQVSAVEQKRVYITSDDISQFDLPVFTYDCERLVIGPDDYPPSPNPDYSMTFDKIYRNFTGAGMYFIVPIYGLFGPPLQKLVFASPACADCTLRGSLTKPDFWVDLELDPTKK
jgi:hypothetical protein